MSLSALPILRPKPISGSSTSSLPRVHSHELNIQQHSDLALAAAREAVYLPGLLPGQNLQNLVVQPSHLDDIVRFAPKHEQLHRVIALVTHSWSTVQKANYSYNLNKDWFEDAEQRFLSNGHNPALVKSCLAQIRSNAAQLQLSETDKTNLANRRQIRSRMNDLQGRFMIKYFEWSTDLELGTPGRLTMNWLTLILRVFKTCGNTSWELAWILNSIFIRRFRGGDRSPQFCQEDFKKLTKFAQNVTLLKKGKLTDTEKNDGRFDIFERPATMEELKQWQAVYHPCGLAKLKAVGDIDLFSPPHFPGEELLSVASFYLHGGRFLDRENQCGAIDTPPACRDRGGKSTAAAREAEYMPAETMAMRRVQDALTDYDFSGSTIDTLWNNTDDDSGFQDENSPVEKETDNIVYNFETGLDNDDEGNDPFAGDFDRIEDPDHQARGAAVRVNGLNTPQASPKKASNYHSPFVDDTDEMDVDVSLLEEPFETTNPALAETSSGCQDLIRYDPKGPIGIIASVLNVDCNPVLRTAVTQKKAVASAATITVTQPSPATLTARKTRSGRLYMSVLAPVRSAIRKSSVSALPSSSTIPPSAAQLAYRRRKSWMANSPKRREPLSRKENKIWSNLPCFGRRRGGRRVS